MSRVSSILLWLMLTMLAGSTGCGPQGGQIALRLKVVHPSEQQALRGGMPLVPGQAPADIDAFRLCIQDGAGTRLVCKEFADLDQQRARVDGIPTGGDRVVTFQGYALAPDTREAAVIWCGRVTGVQIRDNQTTPVSMLITRCLEFTQTPGAPTKARVFHSAVSLPDGRVLISGGYESVASGTGCENPCAVLTATGSAEIYDPKDGTFTEVTGGLIHPRGLHASLALTDGRVLLAGGCETLTIQSEYSDPDRPGSPLRCQRPGQAATSIELFDPATGASEAAELPASIFSSAIPGATDQLLLVGGQDLSGNPLRRVVLLDAAGSQATVSTHDETLSQARYSGSGVSFTQPDASLLEVIVVGGVLALSEDNPGTFAEKVISTQGGIFAQTPGFSSSATTGLPVMHATGTKLSPGRVLMTGGVYPARYDSKDVPFLPTPLAQTTLIDMRFDTLRTIESGSRLGVARAFHTATRVDRLGHVLVAGGVQRRSLAVTTRYEVTAAAEWWDDETEAFSRLWFQGEPIEMIHPRAGHTATRLADGYVLLVGGMDSSSVLKSAEIFNPLPSGLDPEGPPDL